MHDLEDKEIQTPLAPAQTFSDDPLRMMRAIRFASQLNFTIHPDTFAAIIENAARIKIVSGERVADELNKILMSSKPGIGFDLLYKSGCLKLFFRKWLTLPAPNILTAWGIRIFLSHYTGG
ncbi:MAG: hypothetical protein WDM90_22985 [Ferruginibacter sp.]